MARQKKSKVSNAALHRKDKSSSSINQDQSETDSSLSSPALCLPLDMQAFHKKISLRLPPSPPISTNKKNDKSRLKFQEEEERIITRAVELLTRYNMIILHNALPQDDIASITSDYENLLDRSGQTAIGEKDSSKRSGTRFYNCRCQLGPACEFAGWKDKAEKVKCVMARGEKVSEKRSAHREACDGSPTVHMDSRLLTRQHNTFFYNIRAKKTLESGGK